ncbi:MAG: beta-lactamase family protein [Defluviitaleaceae bacterium]|nr:beta-lactamase family protein [Defluviitaleaceae bacterium]
MAITEAARKDADKLSISLPRLQVLDDFLKREIAEETHPAAAVTILRRGVEIFHGAYGVGALDGTPLRDDAIYPLASVTKPVTATMIAMLQEDGRIDIWDRLQQYFPDFVGEGKDEVLLWHLLTHTSGMEDGAVYSYTNDVIQHVLGLKSPGDNASDEDHLDFGMQVRDKMGLPKAPRSWESAGEAYSIIRRGAPLKNKPEQQFSYFNNGYGMLGQIIENISGESLDVIYQKNLFEPLGMLDTHFNLPREKWPRVIKRAEKWKHSDWLNSDEACMSGNGASGLKSTMRDLARFGQMWLQNGTLDDVRILSPASVREFTTNHNAKIPPAFWLARSLSSNWAFGWNIRDDKKDDMGMLRSNKAYDHAGAGGARLMIDPEHDLVMAFYIVEPDDETKPYPLHSRIANIIYSALD